MNQKLSFFQKCQFISSIGFWILVTIAAALWLTVFLVGTLGDSFTKESHKTTNSDIFEKVVQVSEKQVKRYLGDWQFTEPKIPNHFHHIGRWYETDKWSFCITCHGPMPHSRTPQQRAFLNMHTQFMACDVCHVQEQKGIAPVRFGWMALTNGQLCPNPQMVEGVWGDYGDKIVPLSASGGSVPAMLKEKEEEIFAAKFRKDVDRLTDRQKAIGNKFIHRRCVETPVRCSDCHNSSQTFFPYLALGYPPKRAAFLMSDEVADIATHYETFYMPKLLNIDERTQSLPQKDVNDANYMTLSNTVDRPTKESTGKDANQIDSVQSDN